MPAYGWPKGQRMTVSKVEASGKHALPPQSHDHSDVCMLVFSFAVVLATNVVELIPKWSDSLQATGANVQTELHLLQPIQNVVVHVHI